MTTRRPEPSDDLRHDAARRRAVAGLQHDAAREAARRARAGRARRRRHRGRLPGRLARRLGVRRRRSRARSQGPVIGGLARCTREDIDGPGRRSRERARAAHARLPRDQRDPPRAQAQHGARGDRARRGRRREATRARSARTSSSRPRTPRAPSSSSSPRSSRRAIEAGATTINVPDTVGYTMPEEFHEIFPYLQQPRARHRARSTLTVHCHDDLGMAVANSLAAVRAGARQVECTINGIGERAGNCSLEEVVMALKVRARRLRPHDRHRHASGCIPTCRLVSTITGMPIPRNKAIVGENAFAHESGIHQHGMLRNRATYEIMRPEDVGLSRTQPRARQAQRPARVPRARPRARLRARRRRSSTGSFDDFKALADKKKELFDGDIEALVLKAGVERRRSVAAREPARGERPPPPARREWSARRTPTAGGRRRRRPVTVRSTRRSRRSSRRPASPCSCASSRCAAYRGRGRAGRGPRHGRVRRPRLPRHQRHAPTSSSRACVHSSRSSTGSSRRGSPRADAADASRRRRRRGLTTGA